MLSGVSIGYEVVIGYNDVKTSAGVYFYVKRQSAYTSIKTVIPWDLIQLNIGNAMDSKTGVFTAPVNGRYHFSFNGHAWGGDSFVNLRVNGSISYRYIVASSSSNKYNNLPLMATLNLKTGDTVDMWLLNGSLNDDPANYATQFTGILLEEDLVFQQ